MSNDFVHFYTYCKKTQATHQKNLDMNVNSPTTVKQILEGKHVDTGEATHGVTLQALFMLYQRAFLSRQDPLIVNQIKEYAKQLGKACETAPGRKKRKLVLVREWCKARRLWM